MKKIDLGKSMLQIVNRLPLFLRTDCFYPCNKKVKKTGIRRDEAKEYSSSSILSVIEIAVNCALP
jgi:hypothetical protein